MSRPSHNEPVRIARAAHTVSRKDIAPEALKVLYRLTDAGYVAYLAGGGVRDLLLGRRPKDFDVVTSATPNEVRKIFRNCRLVGRRFRLAHVIFGRSIIEVSTFRALQPPAAETPGHLYMRKDDGLVLRDNIFGTPEEDAWRRDFTVNALFYDIRDFSVIDYVNGLPDLQARLLRVIGQPVERFNEDPVRMLRAIRFAATLGFDIEPTAREAICTLRERLSLASRERLYEENLKFAFSGAMARAGDLMLEFNLQRVLFPAFGQWLSEQGDRAARLVRAMRQIDVWIHAGLEPRESLLWAMLSGEYNETCARTLMQGGMPAAAALYNASLDHLMNPNNRVAIPRKVAQDAATLMAMQPSFERLEGRKAERFMTRPGFHDALVYFKFSASAANDEKRKQIARHWQESARGRPPQEHHAEDVN